MKFILIQNMSMWSFISTKCTRPPSRIGEGLEFEQKRVGGEPSDLQLTYKILNKSLQKRSYTHRILHVTH